MSDTATTPFKTINVTRQAAVLHVQMNSPETSNAITEQLLDDLLEVLDALQAQPDLRVLVLSGAGENFCAGADRTAFDTALAHDPTGAELRRLGAKVRRVHQHLAEAEVVTIARLQGLVIGGGLALAAFCDLRAGSDTCRFRMPELTLGLPPAWGGALARLVSEAGVSRIRELVLTGDNFDAARATELGILHKHVPLADLDATIEQWTRPLSRRSPSAIRTAKLLLASASGSQHAGDPSVWDADLLANAIAANSRHG